MTKEKLAIINVSATIATMVGLIGIFQSHRGKKLPFNITDRQIAAFTAISGTITTLTSLAIMKKDK